MKVTIITVCYNSEKYLQKTIDSVAAQTFDNIEYIIVDGASTDSTIDIIKKNESKVTLWVSEPDKGMYFAINKGLRKATGDYILVLNSDDELVHNKVIEEAVKQMQIRRLDYYYGNIIKVKGDRCKKVKLFNVNYQQLLYSTHGTFTPHPCFFISAALNEKIGGYNAVYCFASDYDYILRALSVPGVKGRYMNIYISRFRIHDASITASGKIEQDRQAILKQHRYTAKPYLLRLLFYYSLWMYYKIINAGHRYNYQCV